MAGKGTYAAYQQLQPISTDFGQIAVQQEQLEAQQRAEIAAAGAARRKEKDEIGKRFQTTYESQVEVVTGNKGIDDGLARGVAKARDLTLGLHKEAEKNPGVLNSPEFAMKMANLGNFSKNLAQASEAWTTFGKEVAAGRTDGSLSSWMDKSLNDLNSLFTNKNFDVGVDQETGLPIGVLAREDNEGNLVLDEDGQPILEDMRLGAVLNGEEIAEKIPNLNYLESIKTLTKDLGKRTTTTQPGEIKMTEHQTRDQIEREDRN